MDQREIREQTIRDAKINIILDAARKVFAQRGYHETRLEDIGAAAGFSKASLYNYYEDKETIFLNLANRDFDGMMQTIRMGVGPDRHVAEALESLARTFLTFMGENYAFFFTIHNFRTFGHAVLEDTSRRHQELVGGFQKKLEQNVQLIVDILSAARRRGEIASELDDSTLASFITSLIRGRIFEWKLRGHRGDVERDISDLMSFLRSGLQMREKAVAQEE